MLKFQALNKVRNLSCPAVFSYLDLRESSKISHASYTLPCAHGDGVRGEDDLEPGIVM